MLLPSGAVLLIKRDAELGRADRRGSILHASRESGGDAVERPADKELDGSRRSAGA